VRTAECAVGLLYWCRLRNRPLRIGAGLLITARSGTAVRVSPVGSG
jgi:hypothetical protein